MSCLFISLGYHVKMPADILRLEICDYLMTNPKLLDDLRADEVTTLEDGKSLKEYLEHMRRGSTMGGATEIRAFTKIYKVNVLVRSIPNGKNIEFLENPSYPWIGLEWTGNHYEPMKITNTP